MAVPNFSDNFPQKHWYKFGMAKNTHSEFIETFLVLKDWRKFGWNGQKCTFLIYLNFSSAKRLKEIWNGQN